MIAAPRSQIMARLQELISHFTRYVPEQSSPRYNILVQLTDPLLAFRLPAKTPQENF